MKKQNTLTVYKPTFRKAGVDHTGNATYSVTMTPIGEAKSYKDAKDNYGFAAIVDGYAREMEEV